MLPWAQSTILTVHSIRPSSCVNILNQTEGLVYCNLGLYPDNRTLPSTKPLLRLQTLILSNILADVTVRFLALLTSSSLRRFQIPEEPSITDTLSAFLARFNCILQELCITNSTRSRDFYQRTYPSVKLECVKRLFREDFEDYGNLESDGQLGTEIVFFFQLDSVNELPPPTYLTSTELDGNIS
ncbi:hypothetical protein DFH07DRAFT_119976 [Mycena maculata]|uniref:Uncharacterized protein n=1 Tax=Mycena maculata TaxID=230809 RepID=A0AAD7I5M7_9AGAR|nr:hypothetical protein DFH07DRAFT_119976 [Mycena maculata]